MTLQKWISMQTSKYNILLFVLSIASISVLRMMSKIHLYTIDITNIETIYKENDTFWKHVNDLGLTLNNDIFSNNSLQFIKHSQIGKYGIHKQSNMFEHLSCNFEQLGLGNILTQYWGSRALSHWNNYNFKLNLCAKYPTQSKYTFKNKYFSAYLPKQLNITKSDNKYSMLYAKRCTDNPGFVHESSVLFTFYNKYFANIINKDYNNAIKQFYIDNNLTHKISLTNVFSDLHSDIVIHIRCGNIIKLSIKGEYLDGRYGILTTNYIKYSVSNAMKSIFNIDWIKDRINCKTKIWILSQLTKHSLRPHELNMNKDCKYLINYIVNNSLSQFFHPAQTIIVYDTDINDDFYRMVNAPLLICSPSTFCLSAGMGNINGYVIMPNFGPWIHMDDITNITMNYSDIYSEGMLAKHSKFLPTNHLIVDTLKHKWHVNKIQQYNDELKYDVNKLSYYLSVN
eukprot:240132_1